MPEGAGTGQGTGTAWLVGAAGYVAFEGAAYWLLRLLTSGLGQPDQYQPDNTIVANWLLTTAFVVGHLALVLLALLWLQNRLPRQHRRQLQAWFWLGLAMSFGLLIPLLT